ncbi:MAG: hypothetical protein QNJ19_11055 [Woeseiaceae bacterium]|nr:hypothetical protein [Woeseiaceae bacterium]
MNVIEHAALAGAIFLLLCCSQANAEPDCGAPEQPKFPASLSSTEDADLLRDKVGTYLESSMSYRLCIASYVEERRSVISETDLEELRQAYRDSLEEEKRVSKKWNRAFTKFLSKS